MSFKCNVFCPICNWTQNHYDDDDDGGVISSSVMVRFVCEVCEACRPWPFTSKWITNYIYHSEASPNLNLLHGHPFLRHTSPGVTHHMDTRTKCNAWRGHLREEPLYWLLKPITIAIRLPYDYDEKLTCSFFACVELEAGAGDTLYSQIVVV